MFLATRTGNPVYKLVRATRDAFIYIRELHRFVLLSMDFSLLRVNYVCIFVFSLPNKTNFSLFFIKLLILFK